MTVKGRVQNGVIVLEGDARLPEGADVLVETVENLAQSLFDHLRGVVGQADDLPPDLAAQHDHYLYGVPKS
jgi:hypothetical protein